MTGIHFKTVCIITIYCLMGCKDLGHYKLSAKNVNDSIIVLTNKLQDTSKFRQAIRLLDAATEIDSNYYDSYKNKYYCEASLGDFQGAIKTLTHIIKLRPDSADLYLQAGILKEVINDTVSSKVDFSKSYIAL